MTRRLGRCPLCDEPYDTCGCGGTMCLDAPNAKKDRGSATPPDIHLPTPPEAENEQSSSLSPTP